MSVNWVMQIGDPTVEGWGTLVAYLVAAGLCLGAACVSRRLPAGAAVLWVLAACVMLALGVNKQLDLQMLVRALGRAVARRQGWYGARRGVQLAASAVLACGGVGWVLLWIKAGCARGHHEAWLAIGMTILTLFVLLRVAAFYHILARAGIREMPLLNTLVELCGIGVVSIAAARVCAQPLRM